MFELPARLVDRVAEAHRDQFQPCGQALEFGGRQSGQQVVLGGMMSYGHEIPRDSCVLVLAGDFHADSAVAEEATRGVEHGFAADAKLLARPVSIGAT